LNARFITNPTVAQQINIPEVEAQDWKPGDYPYGERDHIALVVTME
jgi:hypothetical protein